MSWKKDITADPIAPETLSVALYGLGWNSEDLARKTQVPITLARDWLSGREILTGWQADTVRLIILNEFDPVDDYRFYFADGDGFGAADITMERVMEMATATHGGVIVRVERVLRHEKYTTPQGVTVWTPVEVETVWEGGSIDLLVSAYRAIGAGVIARLMELGNHSAQHREEFFRELCPSGRDGLPPDWAIQKYGAAAYVYAHLHASWATVVRWQDRKNDMNAARDKAAVDADDLTDLEIGCRIYTAFQERDTLTPEIVTVCTSRPGLPLVDVADALGLSSQARKQSTGLQHWRANGLKKGTSLLALWGWWREIGDFRMEDRSDVT